MKRLEKRLFMEAIRQGRQKTEVEDFWISYQKPAFVNDYLLPQGMMYLSYGFPHKSPFEFYGIDMSLPLDDDNIDPVRRVMSKRPNYNQASPACRSTYLAWLSEGMVNKDIHIGYLLLYFCGMELYYFKGKNKEQKNYVVQEVKRLLKEFPQKEVLVLRAHYFLHTVQALDALEKGEDLSLQQPFSFQYLKKIPFSVRIAMAQAHAHNKKLSAEWALAYIINHPQTIVRDSTLRVWDKFCSYFILRYKEIYGEEGISLPSSGSTLDWEYDSIDFVYDIADEYKTENFLDVTESKVFLEKMRSFYEDICRNIISFSRYVSRNVNFQKSLFAGLKLPPSLQNSSHEALSLFQKDLAENISSQGYFSFDKNYLEQLTQPRSFFKISPESLQLLNSFLDQKGYAFYPDLTMGEDTYRYVQYFFAYRKNESGHFSEDVYRRFRALFVLFGAIFKETPSHGKKCSSEILGALFQKYSWNYSKETLLYLSYFYMTNKLTLKRLSTFVNCQTEKDYLELLKCCIALLYFSGAIDKEALHTLTLIYEFFGFSSQNLFTHVNAIRFITEEDVLLDQIRDFLLSSKDRSSENREGDGDAKGVILDTKRIKKREEETKRVSLILEEVFVKEDDSEHMITVSKEEKNQDVFESLSKEEKLFLLSLVEKEEWSHSFLQEKVPKKISLYEMIDKVNDWACDVIGETLVSDEGNKFVVFNDIWEDFVTEHQLNTENRGGD